MKILRHLSCDTQTAFEIIERVGRCSVNPGFIVSLSYNMKNKVLTVTEFASITHMTINEVEMPIVKIITLDELEAMLVQ
jgi:hypothetical protein